MGSNIHTIYPGAIVLGYFDNDNIEFIRIKVVDILSKQFVQKIIIDRASVIRIMQRIIEERRESVPKMNQRVIMTLCNEFRNHQIDVNKHMNWESYYVESQRLYDPTVSRGPDLYSIKLNSHLNKPRVGQTSRFYFT